MHVYYTKFDCMTKLYEKNGSQVKKVEALIFFGMMAWFFMVAFCYSTLFAISHLWLIAGKGMLTCIAMLSLCLCMSFLCIVSRHAWPTTTTGQTGKRNKYFFIFHKSVSKKMCYLVHCTLYSLTLFFVQHVSCEWSTAHVSYGFRIYDRDWL